MAGAFFIVWGCFHVPGEQGVPAGGAGKYPALLPDGADHYGGGGFGENQSGIGDLP